MQDNHVWYDQLGELERKSIAVDNFGKSGTITEKWDNINGQLHNQKSTYSNQKCVIQPKAPVCMEIYTELDQLSRK